MTPDKYTIQELQLVVGNGHKLYLHEWGNKHAKTPIIYLHGGPGNGCDNRDKKKFDPSQHHVIFFDQRGSGNSTPKGSIEHNTTTDLIADINKIADHLDLNRFVMVGGSWGSTLALAFGIAEPDKVEAMVLDGIYTATKAENDWIDQGGWRAFFPDLWQEFQNAVPEANRDEPTQYLYQKALCSNPAESKKAAYEFSRMELGLLKLDDQYTPDAYEKYDPAPTIIELHYISNGCFMPEGFIHKNANTLNMPVYMVQGRYDLVCPPQTAFELDQTLPNSKLIWTINGHLRQHEATNIQRLLIDKAAGIG